MPPVHSIRAALLGLALAGGSASGHQQMPNVALPSSSTFTVFARGAPIGSEQMAVTLGADGWTITSSGRLIAPADVVSRRVQARYTAEWKPLGLTVDATVPGQPLAIETTVTDTTAQTHIVSAGQSSDKSDPITADAVLLPSPFWGPFEAVAVRARTAAPGSTVQAYGGSGSFTIRFGDSSPERIQTVVRLIEARRTHFVIG